MPSHHLPIDSLSVQLYSVREQLAADLTGTLSRLVDIGFTKAEPFGFSAADTTLADAARAAGLAIPTTHAKFVDDGDRDALFAAAAAAGIETVIDPFLPAERWSEPAEIDRTVEAFQAAADQAAANGVRIGYHNHAWELEIQHDGRSALEAFAARLDPRVALEVDTYWAHVGGVDVPALLRGLGDRLVAIHVKDGDGTAEPLAQLPVGSGTTPVPAILEAAGGALPVVEFDAYRGDIFEGLATSVAFLTGEDAR